MLCAAVSGAGVSYIRYAVTYKTAFNILYQVGLLEHFALDA